MEMMIQKLVMVYNPRISTIDSFHKQTSAHSIFYREIYLMRGLQHQLGYHNTMILWRYIIIDLLHC